ncbi:MAG: T9SS type A sorting domain-containing protein [Ignavibacteriales bacterium]|nr:T9SS type A sorting domain-containing protein [Ignavibacteriales bacterium]
MTRKFFIIITLINLFLSTSFLHSQVGTLKPTLSLPISDGVFVPYQNGMPVPSFEKQDRQIIDLRGIWKKQRFTANHDFSLAERNTDGYNNIVTEAQDRFTAAYDDNTWEDKNIPGVENTMYAFPKVPEYYQDGVWYRYKFNLSDSVNGKFIKLIFYSVNYIADVWLNGNYLGYHEGGYTPFAFDVSGKLNFSGQNVLAVRVDNPAWGTRTDIVPYPKVDWFNYAGIIHDVYLEISNPVSIVRADIVPKDTNGNIQTSVTVYNKSTITKNADVNIEVFSADVNPNNLKTEKASELIGNAENINGNSSANFDVLKDSIHIFKTNLQIENPKLWSPKNPNLYVMKITLKENGNVLDEFYTQFGIRTVVRSSDKVLLNGKVVFFTGVARHEDHPLYGRSIPIDTIFSDLEKVKDVNANMLRTAHYPNHLFTYLIADRLGIAIVEEIPVWQFDLAEAWQIQNNDRHIHEQMFKEMIFKDYNRPSILFWSTCNECNDVDNRKVFIQKMWAELNGKFKDGRLVIQSAAADRPGPDDPSQAVCDVAGWTLYFGIFYGSSYFGGTTNFLVNAKAKNPGKPVMDTEFGYWSSEDNSTLDKQVKIFNDTFNAFKTFAPISSSGNFNTNGFLMGTTWWCIFDWYSHGHPNGFQSMGLYTMNRSKLKPVGQTLKDTYEPYFNLGGVVTGIEETKKSEVPKEFKLEQNFPNPFNPATVISWQLPIRSYVQLKIFDILGKEVATLVDEERDAGSYNNQFSIANNQLPSGIYFYQIKAGSFIDIKKIVLLK